MGAMYRLKAYFGMVPAEELAEYADEPYAPPVRRTVRDYAAEHDPEPRERETSPRWDDRYVADDDRYDAEEPWERRAARPAAAVDRVPSVAATRSATPAPVRGALAIDPESVRLPTPSSLPEQRERSTGPAALARITTLHPTSYNEARTIGERYRDGIPVIMNLTELDDASAKRLVDFAAGLTFGLHGRIERVTAKVFLLSPHNVTVTAQDKQRIENGFFNQS
jgi:cell division inhibitor SepF